MVFAIRRRKKKIDFEKLLGGNHILNIEVGLQPRVKERDELCLFSCLFPFASETAVQNVQQLKCNRGN